MKDNGVIYLKGHEPDNPPWRPTKPGPFAHFFFALGLILLNIAIVACAVYGAFRIIEGTALAAATPIASATQVDTNTFIFDASASPCKWSFCTFEWRYYGTGTNRLGATLGFGPIVVYTFARPGSYAAVVKEIEKCAPLAKTTCPGTAQVNVTVAA